jgi:hypothetical protein
VRQHSVSKRSISVRKKPQFCTVQQKLFVYVHLLIEIAMLSRCWNDVVEKRLSQPLFAKDASGRSAMSGSSKDKITLSIRLRVHFLDDNHRIHRNDVQVEILKDERTCAAD